MAALHGREDPLLDPARFPRLLRQANDAEIADVRKVGEDDYEISGRRMGGVAPSMPAAPAAPAASAASAESPTTEPRETEPLVETAAAARENGQRFGVRFRRGSRGGMRAADVPLIGVVQIDSPAETEPAGADVEIVTEDAGETGAKPPRPRRAPRKKKAAAAGASAKAAKAARSEAPADDPEVAAPAVKRTRTRARKKAE
jgi:hypothetical protein